MLASSMFQRVATLPLVQITRAKYILAKRFSSESGDDEESKKLFPYCVCCCPDCPSETNCYDSRKYGHCLPYCTRCPEFEVVQNIPTDVFRCTAGERLGPQGQAHKCCQYLNPEYYSYHHMSYYDFHYALRPFRKPCPISNLKP